MWLNCNNSLVSLDKVCYIQFVDDDVPAAYIYFQGRRQPLKIESEDIESLIEYFHQNTIEVKVDK
jgi:hypothetical protein